MKISKSWYECFSIPRTSICLGCDGTIPYVATALDISNMKNERNNNHGSCNNEDESRRGNGISISSTISRGFELDSGSGSRSRRKDIDLDSGRGISISNSTSDGDWRVSANTVSIRGWMNHLCSNCLASISWINQIGCLQCGRAICCTDCLRQPIKAYRLMANRSAVSYTEPMKAWLHRFKFKGDAGYASLMAGMMLHRYELLAASIDRMNLQLSHQPPPLYERLRRWFHQHPSVNYPDVVTFVPSTAARVEERGFNPAERIATLLAAAWRRPAVSLLIRTTDNGRQSHQDRSGRERMLNGTYHCYPRALYNLQLPPNRRPMYVLLVDDVYTTGSTVRACAKALAHTLHGLGVPAFICSYTWARA